MQMIIFRASIYFAPFLDIQAALAKGAGAKVSKKLWTGKNTLTLVSPWHFKRPRLWQGLLKRNAQYRRGVPYGTLLTDTRQQLGF
jgi:hypothetical protein